MPSLGAYYEIEVRCVGEPDPTTGYVASIGDIDAAVRRLAIPRIDRAVREQPPATPGPLVAELVGTLDEALPTKVRSIAWRLTPFYTVTVEIDQMDRALLAQQFSFAAAHRLHVAALPDAANETLFGKCNNPNGHGHNYRLEVTVSTPITPPPGAPPFGLPTLERIVDETVIERFDHRHLNVDTAEFADLIPSVENIAKVSHDLLVEPLRIAGADLKRVTVWETDKTSCTYPA